MFQSTARWIRAHKFLAIGAALLTLFLALNIVSYLHARAMTHFVAAGARTAPPEQLTTASKLGVLLTGVTVPRPVNHETPAGYGMAFTTHRTRSSDAIDLELWHIAAESKQSPRTIILLFHAYASSKQMMLPAARELHEMGYDTLLIDFRGCGGSSGNATTIGFKEADDVIAAMRFAREEFAPDRVILFGDSMGAAAVIRAASIDPKLADGLIVAAPFDRLLSTVENRFAAMKLPALPFARLICFWGGVQHGYWASDHNPAEYATKFGIPVLHLHGAHDPRVTTDQARDLFGRFASAKRFVIFEDAGHASHLRADRAKWVREVRSFVESLGDLR